MKKEKIDVLQDFKHVLLGIQNNMRKLFRGSKSEIAVIHGSIYLAQEAMFQNLFEEGDKILVVGQQRSGKQLEKMATLSHINVTSIYTNEELPLENIENCLKEDLMIKAVLLPLVEENSGVLYRLQDLSKLLKPFGVLLMVSVDETLLMNPFYFDDSEVDVAISTLMNPIRRGQFSFIALSSKAQENLLETPRHFLNLKKLCTLDEKCCEQELPAIDSYREVAELLHLMTYYEMWQWNHYFGALTTYLRNSIQQIGYHIIPTKNYSNSHILIKLEENEDAYTIRSKIYSQSNLIVDIQDTHTLVINMNRFMHIFDTLRLIDALAKCKDTCQEIK